MGAGRDKIPPSQRTGYNPHIGAYLASALVNVAPPVSRAAAS